MKPGSGQQKRTLKQFRQFIENSAGGDALGVFNAYFGTRTAKQGGLKFKFHQNFPQFKNLISIIHNLFNKSNHYDQRQWLSIMRSSGFSGAELRQMGWIFSKRAWTEAGKHAEENFPGAPVQEKRGRRGLSDEIKESIKAHALSLRMSYPAANRTIKVKTPEGKVTTAVVYKSTTDTESFQIWKADREKEGKRVCSESSFRKVLKTITHLKKAKKETDKCEICVEGKKVQLKLNNLSKKNNLSTEEKKLLKKLKRRLRLFTKHRKSAEHQQSALLKQKDNLENNQAIIYIDFSANIILNKEASVEVSREFYENIQRMLFGAVLYWKENNNLKHHYFDIFSDYTAKNSYFVTKALDAIFNHDVFKSKNFKWLSIWMDNGPNHFKTKELFSYFYNIPKNFPIDHVEWNFFVEYHGKSVCDSRFSHVKAMLREYENDPNNPRIISVDQVVSIISEIQQKRNKRQEERNNIIDKNKDKNRDKNIKKKDLIDSTQIALNNLEPVPMQRKVLSLSDFRKPYYSFFITKDSKNNDIICASFLTGSETLKTWLAQEKFKTFNEPVQKGREVVDETERLWKKLRTVFSKRKALSQNTTKRQRKSTNNEEREYTIDKILERRYNRKHKRLEWLVKWNTGEETWEPEENFIDVVDGNPIHSYAWVEFEDENPRPYTRRSYTRKTSSTSERNTSSTTSSTNPESNITNSTTSSTSNPKTSKTKDNNNSKPSKKRKREDDYVFSASPKKPKLETIFSAYREYGTNVPLSILQEISLIDKQFHLSPLLGMSLTANFLLSEEMGQFPYDPVQLIRTADLEKFREYDRTKVPKYPNQDPVRVVNELAASVKAKGFFEPLILLYDKEKNICSLTEGNTRLAVALEQNLEYVPVKIQICTGLETGKKPRNRPKVQAQSRYIPASELGLKTLTKDETHPYLPENLINSLKQVNFHYDYLIDMCQVNEIIEKREYFEVSPNLLFADLMEVDQIGDI